MKTVRRSASGRCESEQVTKYADTLRKRLQKIALGGLLLITALTTTSCVGMIERSMATGDRYSEAQGNAASLPPGYGRLFVYSTQGGPNPSSMLGASDLCTVDQEVHQILGRTYWFVDLPAGSHRVTIGGVPAWGYKKAEYGKHAVEFELEAGEVKYCWMDLSGFPQRFKPSMVESAVAQTQLPSLKLHETHHMRGVTIKD